KASCSVGSNSACSAKVSVESRHEARRPLPSSANRPSQAPTHPHGQGQHIGLLESAREVGSGRERIGGAGEQDDHPIPGDRGGDEESVDLFSQLLMDGRGPCTAGALRCLREGGGCPVPHG